MHLSIDLEVGRHQANLIVAAQENVYEENLDKDKFIAGCVPL